MNMMIMDERRGGEVQRDHACSCYEHFVSEDLHGVSSRLSMYVAAMDKSSGGSAY